MFSIKVNDHRELPELQELSEEELEELYGWGYFEG